MNHILLIDDEVATLNSMELALQLEGYDHIYKCSDSREVFTILKDNTINVIILDLTMPHISGEQVLNMVMNTYPEIKVIIISANDAIESVIRCMKAGAVDYLTKPITTERLLATIKNTLEIILLKSAVESLKTSHNETIVTPNENIFAPIITQNKVMLKIFRYATVIAPSPYPVLIYGETGTGKELMARAIHQLSGRKGEFIAVNAAGLDENMFIDTLFGHNKGAYTGADKTKIGLVEAAKDGTLFLDEIGDIPSQSQIKLLRLLQENEYLPLGAETNRKSTCRILAATNLELNEMQQKKLFRQDLFYRLNDHFIHLTPLRERKDDIPLLVSHYLNENGSKFKSFHELPAILKKPLTTHNYPGNIRELKKLIFEFCQTYDSSLNQIQDIIKRFHLQHTEITINTDDFKFPAQLPTLKQMQEHLVNEAVSRANGNQSTAARWLGVTPQALSQMKKRQEKRKQTKA